ncbi:MAG: PA0069 family radical SAM protein [Planctomycetaceae bacterium]
MRHGSNIDPPNRFETVHRELDLEHLEWDEEHLHGLTNRAIEYIDDDSKSLVVKNNSPDIPFLYSVNPYRGCAHGCSYCYARPYHEYLGLNAGLDFETKILVKRQAGKLLREFLGRDSWDAVPIMFSGVTDCYQPAEREFRLTRQCLEVAAECNQSVAIITKNALVVRDVDLLSAMARQRLVQVNISITTLNSELSRDMEPRCSMPAARLRAVKMLTEAGVPVRVMVAPIIPGLTDHEVPHILKEARVAGALDARYTLLRLPLTVEPVFLEWLKRTQPLKADKVEQLIRSTHDGELSESRWGKRMSGTGKMAEQIRTMFQVFRKKLNFDKLPGFDTTLFKPPQPRRGQLRLF